MSELIETFASPLIWAGIIYLLTTKGITTETLPKLYILSCLGILRTSLSWACHGPARVKEEINAFKVRTNYRQFFLNGIFNLPLDWHIEHHSGDTIDKISRGTSALFDFSESSFVVIRCIIQFIGSYCALVYFSHISGVIILAMLAISAWITMRFDRVLIPQYRELNHNENQITESIFDAISNISTIIILRVEKAVFTSIMHAVDKPFELFRKNCILNETKWFCTSICCNTTIALVVSVYFYQHRGAGPGALVTGTYLLVNYLDKVAEIFYRFTELYSDIVRRRSRVANAEELSTDFSQVNFANHVLPSNWKELSVENLTFGYKSSEAAHAVTTENVHQLRNVSLTIKRGTRVALIGQSGSGKTTFLKIMRALHTPDSLELKVDCMPVHEGFDGICRAITLVPQKAEIFATTIENNITMRAEHDIKEIEHVTKLACFYEVVQRLPKKYQSSIKEKGVNLSGGEQQRLALARGLLACKDKDIILLDEPTTGLDNLTQFRVYENIFREYHDKTVVSVLHHLHILPLFDYIYMFEQGRIIASGTLKELMQSSSAFVDLWNAAQKNAHEEELV